MRSVTSTLRRRIRPEEDGLVRDHLDLVRRAVTDLAARMPRHASRDDLVSAGMNGLAQAARNFDDSLGVPFASYASARIKGALLDELRGADWASRPVRAKARRLAQVTERLTSSLDRVPTDNEVAEALDVTIDSLRALRSDLHRATVLNYESILPDSEGNAADALIVDGMSPEVEILERERNAYLVDAIRALPERLQVVVKAYFFEDRSMRDISAELGVTESRVSQLRAEALDLLRDGMNSQLDPEAVPSEARPDGRVARRRAAYFAAIAVSSTPVERVDAAPRVAAVPA